MKDYFILIHIIGTPLLQLSQEKQQNHIRKATGFIQKLAEEGVLRNAQPFEPKGISIAGKTGSIKEKELNAGPGDVVGFYHVVSDSIDKIVTTFKSDPRFEDTEWKMDIWPILKLEGIN